MRLEAYVIIENKFIYLLLIKSTFVEKTNYFRIYTTHMGMHLGETVTTRNTNDSNKLSFGS